MRIAINGFGRIGRTFFRQAFGARGVDIVAINDLGDVENLAYLLEHDSVYRSYDKKVSVSRGALKVDKNTIPVFSEKDPANLPWKKLRVDVVVESTGFFTSTEKSNAHIAAGARRVVISAPAHDEAVTPTATPNVGVSKLKNANVTSNASCTTNAITPVVSILMSNPGIEKGMLSTVHGYTATQKLVDGPDAKDWTRGRAAAMNIVPASTGAARAVGLAIPSMKGKFDGIAFRVPVVSGSIIDFTFVSKRTVTVEKINTILRNAARDKFWEGIFTVSEVPLVSTDILGNSNGSIADLSFTRVVDGNLVKVLSWYDNEWGYCAMLLKHVLSLKMFF